MFQNVIQHLSFLSRSNLVVDLGNRNTVFSHEDEEIFSSASAIAYRLEKSGRKTLVAIGQKALELEGKIQNTVQLVQPLKDGMVTDTESAGWMLSAMVSRGRPKLEVFGKVLICAPAAATTIEKMAFRDAAAQLNSSKIFMIPEPMAAAVGAGLDVNKSHGRLIVDVGDGIVESALISMGEIVSSHSVRLENQTHEAQLRSYLREAHNFHIGRFEAEKLKLQNSDNARPDWVELNGFCSVVRLPVSKKFPTAEFEFIRENFTKAVLECVLKTLECASPQLSLDLAEDGIILTGGNCMDRLLKTRMEHALKIKISRSPSPLLGVTKGARKALSEPRFHSLLERCS